MGVWKSFLMAVSMYSRIPVPGLAWKEEDMKYMFCFFPWIGAAAGGCLYAWCALCSRFSVTDLCRTAVGMAVPLLLTGGFHVDGFLDTMDAFHSYRPRERKLEILKDSHIGAFAVIMLAAYGLVWAGAFSEVKGAALLKVVCSGFFLSRSLCGISAVSFPLAREEGMLFTGVSNSQSSVVKLSLYLQSAVCAGFMIFCSPCAGVLALVSAFLALAYYYYRCKREFGGVTGDTAGYFILLCEICILVAAAGSSAVI